MGLTMEDFMSVDEGMESGSVLDSATDGQGDRLKVPLVASTGLSATATGAPTPAALSAPCKKTRKKKRRGNSSGRRRCRPKKKT
jgi:hypothetical protein